MSKVKLDMDEDLLSICYNDCVSDLFLLEDVQSLKDYCQHMKTSRLQHSLNVSYYSFLVCRYLHFDYRSAARAGLLHDLFLYDWREERQPEGRHISAHPKVALRTAQKNVELNKVEADAIVKHMWPLTIKPPRYKESIIVSMMDKYCTCCELIDGMSNKLINKAAIIKRIITETHFAKQ